MPDLLTHALVGFVIASALSFKYDWLTAPYVTVCMMGTFIPDLTKIRLAVSSARIEAWLGFPFDWFGLHTVGGAVLSTLIGSVLVPPAYRKRVFALLALGAASHFFLDALLIKSTGHMAPLLWPLTAHRFATPGLYLSSDRWPAAVAGALAAGVWYAKKRSNDRPSR